MSTNHPRLRKVQNVLLWTAVVVLALLPFPW
jgi:hypothetical protein